MTTNTKQFKQQVRDYIVSVLGENQTIGSVHAAFVEQVEPYYTKHYGNKYRAIEQWFMGLQTSLIAVDFEHYSAMQEMKKWFENCGKVYDESRFNFDQFLNYVSREFYQLLELEQN